MLGFISNEQPYDQKLYHVRKKKMRKKKKKRLNGNVLNNVDLSIKLISSEHRALCKNLLFRSLVDYRRILSEAPGRINLLANESYG